MDLIHILQTIGHPLREILDEHGMVYAEGYKRGNKKKVCDAFIGMPLLEARTFAPGRHSAAELPQMNDRQLECTVDTKRKIFKGPHLATVFWGFMEKYGY